jgi:uncharacterized protein YecT (DUF1311 family)
MKITVIALVFVLGLSMPLGRIAEGYSTYDATNSTRELLETNPLDRDYKRDMLDPENGTTYGMADVYKKYIKLWDRELNVVYQKLLLKLNDEEKELLVEAQVGWLQYHENEQRFTSKALSKNFGTIFILQQGSSYLHRLRERTLQLMAYYRRLGGEVEFEYKGDGE